MVGVDRVTVVVVTRNRAARLREALTRLNDLPEQPNIIVVDNGSQDDTLRVVADAGARVRGIPLAFNAGAAGRNIGVAEADTPYVAFSDDDSWWAAGALRRSAAYFDRYRGLGLIAGRIAVGEGQCLDAICGAMENSPLGSPADLPGPAVMGFIACAAVVRRKAFLDAGGFHLKFDIGGEENLLAIDLARHGWQLAYCKDVLAHHYPDGKDARAGRRARMLRNDLWTAWLRASPLDAVRATKDAVQQAIRDPIARPGLLDAVRGLPWVLKERRSIGPALEQQLSLLAASRRKAS